MQTYLPKAPLTDDFEKVKISGLCPGSKRKKKKSGVRVHDYCKPAVCFTSSCTVSEQGKQVAANYLLRVCRWSQVNISGGRVIL